ncbi:MAG: hypothetical protein P8O79_12335 [Halieaceae bacterium]|nr:hypothetical protein [Halieaceae bacterium]
MTYWRGVVLGLVVIVVSGCTFNSGQLDALREAFKPTLANQYGWVAQYGQTQRGVVAIVQGDLVVFANEQGDAISFDGWVISRVTGFDLADPLTVQAPPGARRYGNGRLTTAHACTAWGKLADTHMGWQQHCESEFSYQNVITLDDQGRIIQINQVVEPSGTRLILTKR